jgi:D-3-phosphoglycerate dehydrogenase
MYDLHGEKILIGPSTFSEIDRSPMERLLRTGCQVIDNPFKRKLTKAELMDLLATGATGLIAGLETLDREVMEKSTLKVISRCGSGMTNIDQTAATELGIKVFSTPDGPTSAVAELTVGALLGLLRNISLMDKEMHAGKWTKKIGRQLEGKNVLIIGFGRIGQKVAALLTPFKVQLMVVDPLMVEHNFEGSVMNLEDALPKADIISLHASGEDCILGEKEFQIMKPGAIVLNAARGGLIDENALEEALVKRIVQGAWLDAFKQEPYTGKLAGYSQVVLTPHVGSYTLECRRKMEMETVENLVGFLNNEKGIQNED